jgi:two-component system LytT family response regulator
MSLPSLSAIIVDDEPNAVGNLRNLLQKYCPFIKVIDVASGVDSAVFLINELKPQVVFLDISMPRRNGFELLNLLDHKPAIVFVTAHQEYAINAIKACAVDYLLKPIDINELKRVGDKLVQLHRLFLNMDLKKTYDASVGNLTSMLGAPGVIKTITISENGGYEILDTDKVLYLEGKDNYTIFHLVDGKKITTSRTLKDFETLLRESDFFRIHKSHMINLRFLKNVSGVESLSANLEFNIVLDISRRRASDLFKRIKAHSLL